MPDLTHLNAYGNAHMVDIGAKPSTGRVAVARAEVHLTQETLRLVQEGKASKGDVLTVSRVAGIMAAKKTADLIPLCHPLALTSLQIDFNFEEWGIGIECRAETTGPTGVEMEALTGVAVAALTIYDMVKAVERGARISNIHLAHKSGGKSGVWDAAVEK